MRRASTSLLATVVASGVLATGASAQADLATMVRAGTARYQDQAAAIADGYRQVGPDFPSMGEHWVSTALLVSGVLDPARPQVLEYATIAERPTLLGVAFAVLADSAPPTGLPVPPSAWHTHAGTVDEESFVLSHAEAQGHRHDERPGPRVAILHAWVWLDNPAGLLATDNWAIPFARLGFAAPDTVSPAAARGAALAAGGARYFQTLIRVVARPDSTEQAKLDTMLAAASLEVGDELGRGTGNTVLPAAQVAYLEMAWERTWNALLEAASPPVRQKLAGLSGAPRRSEHVRPTMEESCVQGS